MREMRSLPKGALALGLALELGGAASGAPRRGAAAPPAPAAPAAPASASAAEPPPAPPSGPEQPTGRSVAVLEYRTASAQAQDLAGRLGQAVARNTALQVIDGPEGRRRLGSGLDKDVSACNGEPACLGRIGQRLGASEVLFLAVSQIGDMVMAIQRIDEGGRVTGRVADSVPAGQILDEARILTWLQQLYPPETFKRYGQIRVSTDVGGAQVYVNAKARGQTPLHEPIQVLAPGNYRILVEKSRHLPFQAQFTVMPETTVEVQALLPKELVSRPWYQRWYVWAGIGAGLALAGGAAALAASLSREPPDMTRVPGTIEIR